MQLRKPREYQTLRLFATLGFLTLLFVLLFKVVLFGPVEDGNSRGPALHIEAPVAPKTLPTEVAPIPAEARN